MRWSSSVTISEAWRKKNVCLILPYKYVCNHSCIPSLTVTRRRPTSLLVRPPLPHLCSLKVCKEKKTGSHCSASVYLYDPNAAYFAATTHQVFKLCWQAAVVGFLHVHYFGVGAKNIEFSWSKKIKRKQVWDDCVKCCSFERRRKKIAHPRIAATSPDSL